VGKERRDELDDGKIDDILAALALHVKTNEVMGRSPTLRWP
jgi:hypothetical protein